MDQFTISIPETSFVTSETYAVSDCERSVENHIEELCANWTLEGLQAFQDYYSEEVQSKLNWESSELVSSEYGGKSSTPSGSAIERRPRRADYWATPRRATILLLLGTYLKDDPLLREDIKLEWREHFESWSTKLTEGLAKSGDRLPGNLDWRKFWNACFIVIGSVYIGDSQFKSFCSLLTQVGSIETSKTRPEDTLSSVDLENGDQVQDQAEEVPEAEIKV